VPDSAARVHIRRHAGPDIEAYHDLTRPLSAAAREARVRAKATVLLGQPRANALWNKIGEFARSEAVPDWRALFAI
jgi:hypothetical protein